MANNLPSNPVNHQPGAVGRLPWRGGRCVRMLPWLACGLAIGLTYRGVLADLWTIWTTQQDYSHGILVVPFACYLAWRASTRLRGVDARPSWLGLAVLVAAFLMREIGLRCYYGSAERISLIVAIWGVVLVLAGWQVVRRLAGPMLFLLLMIPPPNQVVAAITLPMQRMAAFAAAQTLGLMGWHAALEGNTIRLYGQSLEVAEACNGLRMVFAILTLGCAIACMVRRPLWERITVVASSIALGVVVNVIRIVATGVAGQVFGTGAIAAAHDVGGWLMMPLALLVMWWEQRFLQSLFVDERGAAPATMKEQLCHS
ncbi:MAG TPA: exosortase/archaeosortase family protein [Planctomycetota bacterium]|nr:exosortase/archaeosortase family protein [Planctomycetota bacterium]